MGPKLIAVFILLRYVKTNENWLDTILNGEKKYIIEKKCDATR